LIHNPSDHNVFWTKWEKTLPAAKGLAEANFRIEQLSKLLRERDPAFDFESLPRYEGAEPEKVVSAPGWRVESSREAKQHPHNDFDDEMKHLTNKYKPTRIENVPKQTTYLPQYEHNIYEKY